jgi:hypothetical protein
VRAAQLQKLLRPVRELDALWEIRLRQYLDPYLEYLSNLVLDDDGNDLNCPEAGLFLQSTTHIYAKKVRQLDDLATKATVVVDSIEPEKKWNQPRQRDVQSVTIDSVTSMIRSHPTRDCVRTAGDPNSRLSQSSRTASSPHSSRLLGLRAVIPPGSALNEKDGVILLDSSLTFYGPDEGVQRIVGSGAQSPASPPGGDSADTDAPQPPPDDQGEEDDAGDGEEGCIPGHASDREPSPPIQPENPFAMLDPDDTSLAFTARPFRRNPDPTNFVLPDARGASKTSAQKQSQTSQPLHRRIFRSMRSSARSGRSEKSAIGRSYRRYRR